MTVVCNAGPLIALGKLGRLGLLQKLFGEVAIAREVYREVVLTGHKLGFSEAEAVDFLIQKGVVRIIDIELAADHTLSSSGIDIGEIETIILARCRNANWVLIDDRQARDDLARASVVTLSFVAQSARGDDKPPVPQNEIDRATTIPERFLIRWRGEANPDHVRAINAYWISAAEHGMNASTFTARVVASTGADVAAALSSAVGSLSGPLHGGAPSRVLKMLDEVALTEDARKWVIDKLDSGERLMGFGHRVYRAEDPRARVLRRVARELESPRYEVAMKLEEVALEELRERHPERVLATNVEFWSAVVLDLADVPPPLFTSMFTCARVAGWSAHILEQKRSGRLIRPTANYVGPENRTVEQLTERVAS